MLWANVAIHGIGFVGDLWSVQQGRHRLCRRGPSDWIAHLIVLLGGAYYLWRPTAK